MCEPVISQCDALALSQVEKDKFCKDLILKWFEGNCVFSDILDLCATDIPKKRLLKVKEVELKGTGECARHNQQCSAAADHEGFGVLGAPCVLFSKTLSSILRDTHKCILLFGIQPDDVQLLIFLTITWICIQDGKKAGLQRFPARTMPCGWGKVHGGLGIQCARKRA